MCKDHADLSQGINLLSNGLYVTIREPVWSSYREPSCMGATGLGPVGCWPQFPFTFAGYVVPAPGRRHDLRLLCPAFAAKRGKPERTAWGSQDLHLLAQASCPTEVPCRPGFAHHVNKRWREISSRHKEWPLSNQRADFITNSLNKRNRSLYHNVVIRHILELPGSAICTEHEGFRRTPKGGSASGQRLH